MWIRKPDMVVEVFEVIFDLNDEFGYKLTWKSWRRIRFKFWSVIMIEEPSTSAIKLSITKLWQKPFPEGTFAHSMSLKDLWWVWAECQGLPLERGVKGPICLRPGVAVIQRGIAGKRGNIMRLLSVYFENKF